MRRQARLAPWLLAPALLAGCAAVRIVPVAAPDVVLDPRTGSVTAAAEGVSVTVRPSAWRGSPFYLEDYVTPFHMTLWNATPQPVSLTYADLRLYDQDRVQSTALAPAEVVTILRGGRYGVGIGLAAGEGTAEVQLVFHWRRFHHPFFYDPFFYDPWWYAPPPPRLDEIFTEAFPAGTVHPGARVQGFVYFPRLGRGARSLTLEVHYRLGDAPRVLTLPFAVQRDPA
ncbi:MAG: hypothetical protein HYY19_05530 [Candidatus Rokubacteria bacterium]|nr:hypothetical protein [Candidatus Rokubacteria bacterium]